LERFALGGVAHARRILDVQHGVAEGVQLHALEFAGQDAARPLARGDGLHLPALAGGHQHHKAGQVIRLGAQSVEYPRSHAGAARDDGAGVHQRVGGVVIDLLGPHGAHDADIVGHAADVRKQRADLLAGFAELLKRMLRAETGQALALELRDLLPGGEGVRHGLAGHLGELGFVVEGFQVRGAAAW
jgi:hypothetical protein